MHLMKNNVVLILAPEADVHARSVAKALKNNFNTESRIIDLRTIAQNAAITWSHDADNNAVLVDQSGPLFLEDVISVWYRRPQRPLPDSRVEDSFDRTHVQNEWNTAFHSILRNAVPYWVNPMEADIQAGKKPVQLQAAQKVGLRTPRTLITNARADIEAFLNACNGNVIFKPLTAHPNKFLETRVLDSKAMAHLNSLFLSPVLFQEKVNTRRDLRVTIMGEHVSAVAIDSQQSQYPLDSRIDMGVRHEPVELDPCLSKQLLDLMSELGLIYGAVDLIETKDDEIVFLEVNPGGQFLYIELLASIPLSFQMADLLRTPPTLSSTTQESQTTTSLYPAERSSANVEPLRCPATPFVVAAPHAAPTYLKSREAYSQREQQWKKERGLEDPTQNIVHLQPLPFEQPAKQASHR